MTETLRLRVLGNTEVTFNGAPVTGFVSCKARALLCYLAVSGCCHSREKLAALLWGDMPDAKARTNLRQAVANINKLLPGYLIATRQEVSFNKEASYWLDNEALLEQIEAKTLKPPLSSAAASALADAVALYRGDFLEECHPKGAVEFEEWSLIWRERLRNLTMRGLHALVVDHNLRREYSQAIAYAQKLLILNPWQEETHRQLMLLLARSGQRNAALARYHTCKQILADELGVEPMAETTALYHRIQAIDPTRRHNLPPQPTAFIGRREELDKLTTMLSHPDYRLLTIVGPGGVGKTRLALQAAKNVANDFLNGVLFVSLTAINSTALTVTAIADALNLSFHEREHPTNQLLHHLRHSNKEILLVLDNFEHLLAPAVIRNDNVTQLLLDILKSASNLKILVTSRERLNLRWENLFLLQGLRVPAGETVDALENYDSLQLFLYRAQQARQKFTPDNAQLARITKICRLLDGIPLALELAAAWTATHTCQEIIDEIERNLGFLTSPLRDAPDRHKSLRAVLHHSWNLLTFPEQAVFEKLAVFQGGFDFAAAEQITGASPAVLSALLDKSLLQRVGNSHRYNLHQMWRQFLLEQLTRQPGEYTQTKRKHSQYYLNFLQDPTKANHLEPEFENLWAGWQWTATHGKAADTEAYIEGLAEFLETQNRLQELITLFEQALESAEKNQIVSLKQAAWRRRLGDAYFKIGRLPKSREHHLQALAQLEYPMPETTLKLGGGLGLQLLQQGWRILRPARQNKTGSANRGVLLEAARAYERLGQIYFFSGQSVEGVYTSLRGLNLAESVSPSPELARLYANMGLAMGLVPLHALSRRYLDLAISTANRVEHQPSLAWVLELSSIYYSGVGAWTQVEQLANKGAELNKQLGHIRQWEECVVMLAHRARFRGQFQRSIEIWTELYESALQRGDAQTQRWGLTGQVEGLLPLGRLDEAIDLLELALSLPLEVDDSTTDISAYGLLSVARLRLRQLEAAEAAAEKAQHIIAQSLPTAYSALEGYAAAAEAWLGLWETTGQTRFKAPAQQTCKALRGFARVFPVARPRAGIWQGVYYRLNGNSRQAQATWRKSLAIARQFDMVYETGLLHTEMGRHLPANDPARAAHLNQAAQIFTRLNVAPQNRWLRE